MKRIQLFKMFLTAAIVGISLLGCGKETQPVEETVGESISLETNQAFEEKEQIEAAQPETETKQEEVKQDTQLKTGETVKSGYSGSKVFVSSAGKESASKDLLEKEKSELNCEENIELLTCEWGYSEQSFHTAKEYIDSLDLTKYHYTFGNVIAELTKNQISYSSIAYESGAFDQKSQLLSDTAIMLEDGSTLYFMSCDIAGQSKSINVLEKRYEQFLWKVNDKADYSYFAANSILQNRAKIMETMDFSKEGYAESYDLVSELECMLARNYVYAKHGYQFENKELDAFFHLYTWYEPKYTKEEFSKQQDLLLTEEEKEYISLVQIMEKAYAEKNASQYEILHYVNGSSADIDHDGNKEILWAFCNSKEDEHATFIDLYTFDKDQNQVQSMCAVRFAPEYGTVSDQIGAVYTKDQKAYLFLEAHVESSDYESCVYLYQDGIDRFFTFTKRMPAWFDGDVISFFTYAQGVETYTTTEEYRFSFEEMTQMEKNYYEIGASFHFVSKQLEGYKENKENSEKIALEPGDFVEFMGEDSAGWLKLYNHTKKETVWLKLSEDGEIVLEETSTFAGDVFTNIHQAG